MWAIFDGFGVARYMSLGLLMENMNKECRPNLVY